MLILGCERLVDMKNRIDSACLEWTAEARFLMVILFLSWPVIASGAVEELCVVKTPLDSPYFIPYIETPNPCSGCLFSEHAAPPDNIAVHIIQVERLVDSVLKLDIVGTTNAFNSTSPSHVFVITSTEPFPISIVTHTDVEKATFKYLIRSQDSVYFYGPNSKHFVESRIWNDPEEAMQEAKKELGHISSFTTAKHVNKMIFLLNRTKDESETSEECSIHRDTISPAALCSLLIKKQTSGCFHDRMLGYGTSDIHIIEIDSEMDFLNSSGKKMENKETILHITDSEDETSSQKSPVKRNLTLVLRSAHPTLWKLQVSNVQGSIALFVADTDSQVENRSCPGVSVSVKHLDLPKTFDQTILYVLNTIGPQMVSYTRTEAPSVIQLVVTKKKKSVKTSKNKLPGASSPDLETNYDQVSNLLSRAFRYECHEEAVTMMLPLWVDKRIGGVSMSLRDSMCRGSNNGTHLLLRSKLTECGFSRQDFRDHSLYTNVASFDLGRHPLSLSDDEDFEGSGFDSDGIIKMIKCKVRAREDQKTNLESPEKEVKYKIQISRDQNFKTSELEFPLTILSESNVYAKVKFAKEPTKFSDLKLLIEECSLSSSPSHYVTKPVTLISKSCSSQSYVTVVTKNFIDINVDFHFVLSLAYLPSNKVYLHCQIGVCYNNILPQPYLKKCVDPQNFCSKYSLMKAFDTQAAASLIDTVVVGPFHVQAAQDSTLSLPSNASKMSNKSPVIVFEGLSTEVVVGIAIASFIIGVTLTATLWVIYLKTDPRRQNCAETVLPRNSAYDISGHSGSSTPSSQAPMTT